MAAVFAEREVAKMFRASESCSVCLDAVSDSGERSIAKLKCGHHFHLDCIGSAFNVKGAMQCPNCRHVEHGQWLYATGSRLSDEFSIDFGSRLSDDFLMDAGIRVEEYAYEEDPNEPYPAFLPFLVAPESLNHFDWCPYQHGNLAAGGSSYEQVHFSVPLRHDDGAARILPEVVVNVSYNYSESSGVSSSSTPPVCPYLEAQARPSRGAEDSRLRPPVLAGRPIRPLDASGASNSASSVGSSIGNGDVFNSRGNIWSSRLQQSGYGHRNDPSIFGEQPRLSHAVDLPFFHRSSPAVYGGDTGSGQSASERSNSWSRAESERLNSQYDSVLGTELNQRIAQLNPTELVADGGGLSVGPCPRPRFAHGQVGTSQLQPQGSFLRSAPTGSNRRTRQNGIMSPSTSGGRTDTGHTTGELSRRYSHSWTDLSLSLGPEPPVPGLESQGPVHHQTGGQSSAPWRREGATEPFTSAWTPGQLWHPPARTASGSTLTPNNFRHSDFLEGHGSSYGSTPGSTQAQSDLEQYRSSLSTSFGIDGAGAGSSIPHRIHLPTPYTIPLRPR